MAKSQTNGFKKFKQDYQKAYAAEKKKLDNQPYHVKKARLQKDIKRTKFGMASGVVGMTASAALARDPLYHSYGKSLLAGNAAGFVGNAGLYRNRKAQLKNLEAKNDTKSPANARNQISHARTNSRAMKKNSDPLKQRAARRRMK